MKKNHCFIYCRQSSGTEDSADSISIAQQEENCRRTAAENQLEIKEVFRDANVSGKTYPAGAQFEMIARSDSAFQDWFHNQTGTKEFRPELGKLMNRLEEVQYIIVDDITRLHRSTKGSFLEQTVNYLLTRAGVKILQVKGGCIDLSRFDQNLIQMLRTQINDEQIANQKNKSMESRRRIRDSGCLADAHFWGGINDGKKVFHFDPAKAEVIRYIFRSIAAMLPYSQICSEIAKRFPDVLPPSRIFHTSTLYHIAENPVYCGFMYNSSKELIFCRNAPPPLISLHDFEEVRRIVSSRRGHGGRPRKDELRRRDLPLSGFLFCGNCGAKMVVNIDRGKIFYYCRTGALRGDPGCSRTRIFDRYETCDSAAGLRQALQPLLALAFQQREEQLNARRNTDCRKTELQTKIQDIEQKLQILFAQFCEGFFEPPVYRKLSETAAIRLREMSHQLRELEFTRPEDDRAEKDFERLRFRLTAGSLDAGEYEKLLRESIFSLVVREDLVEINTIRGTIILPRLAFPRKRRLMPQGNCTKIMENMIFYSVPEQPFPEKYRALSLGSLEIRTPKSLNIFVSNAKKKPVFSEDSIFKETT